MKAVLQARAVEKKFGAVVAAANITIDIFAGERVSLIGSNGAGKTTFVNMITGYLKPDQGQILLDGHDITPLHPRAITRLGVARSFQIPQIYGELNVLDNMLVANACHDQSLSFWQPARRRQAIERAEALLERFALTEHRSRRVAELPGGIRKLFKTLAAWICSNLRRATRSIFLNFDTARLWNKASVSVQANEWIMAHIILR